MRERQKQFSKGKLLGRGVDFAALDPICGKARDSRLTVGELTD
jgi:hypothetical protein